MTQTSNPFDTSDLPYVTILDGADAICYGPMTAPEAMTFCDKWNTWLADRNLPGTWKAIPLAKP